MNLDAFLHRRRTADYVCTHLVVEVWRHLTGRDLRADGASPASDVALLHRLRRLPALSDPCIVLMQGGVETAHVGVYVKRRVIHLQRDHVEYVPLDVAAHGFRRLSYFA